MKVLISGATGYVGSRLIPKVISAGHEVSCLVRDASRVPWAVSRVAQIVVADPLRPATLAPAMQGVDVAYYLIHSMSAGSSNFRECDVKAARNFASAAREAGVGRIIYLGALGAKGSEMSEHLESRQETGNVLREYGPPVTEFRAGILVGNGSASFELVRYLTERLPVMICPRWVITSTQPIAIDDALEYLAAALNSPQSIGKIIEIGGATVETYRSMMLTYARARGLKRYLLRVPVLTPRLSSYWLRLVTPVATAIARPLIEGLRTEVVCRSPLAGELFPSIHPVSYAEAVKRTLDRKFPDETLVENLPVSPQHIALARDGILCDVRQCLVHASPDDVFAVIAELGGADGYLYANALWRTRSWLDWAFGGARLKRRVTGTSLNSGDYFDFWFVEDLSPGKRLLLRAVMKVPGRACLEFVLTPADELQTLLRCIAWFEPRGLAGELYWWILYPAHILIFRGMVSAIGKRASKGNGRSSRWPAGSAVRAAGERALRD